MHQSSVLWKAGSAESSAKTARGSPSRKPPGTYLLGVALGCMIAGFIFYGRYQAKQRQTANHPPPPATQAP